MTEITKAQSAARLKKHVAEVCGRIGGRMIGTPGDHASARYMEDRFREYGLEVISHTMKCVGWDLESTALRVAGRSFPAIGNMYSPAGRGTGRLVLSEPVIPDRAYRDLAGAVVLVYGRFEPYPDTLNGFARKAEKAGVAAVVVVDDTSQNTSATKLIRERELKRMPVMSVSLETGFRLARLEGKPTTATVKARRYPSTTRDVIGILPGGGREICIEAHRDTAPDTPGADDNGSGTVVLLELARLLAREPRGRTIRFVSATAEEFGNVGTPVYARTFARELKRIDLMINADCVGGLLCPVRVYVQEKDKVAPLVERLVRPYRTLTAVRTPERRYGQILEYLGPRVSAANVVSDWANARIHTPKDQSSNLSPAKLAEVSHFLRDLVLRFDALY